MAENSDLVRRNYCALPFNHTVVNTQGNFMPCCHHYIPKSAAVNVAQSNYDAWSNSEYMQQVRKSFELDARHPGCGTCWQLEDRGLPSPRTRSQKEYKILGVKQCVPELVNIEIQMGNLCNLKCVMCDETGSSQLLAENQKLKISKHDQKDFNWSEQGCARVQELVLTRRPKILTLRGGEPLYNPRLLQLLQELPDDLCNSMMLIMVTNATAWSDIWAQTLSRFRLVKFVFSIDATGGLYEYIRFPGNWRTVESNVLQMMRLPRSQGVVNAVIQNLNIGHVGDLIDWTMQHNIFLHLNDIIRPDYLQIVNLPGSWRTHCVRHLDAVLKRSLPDHVQSYLQIIYDRLLQHDQDQYNSELWAKFQNIITQRDQLRGNSHRQFMTY